MKAAEIRSTFLQFFESKGHTIVASSPVIPGDDPTLLFTNAGMNQFKDVFLGFDKRAYSRATTSQKCIRAGGKHNDLDNVGYTARHHTFFEMLGNFSFGDYFKQDAIRYAWELLTEHFKLPADKLWVTVYAEDDEAYQIWNKGVGVPAERIVRIGDNKGGRYMSDNFWMMGDTGPCGPCTEIFYDHGPEVAGGPPGSANEDGDRYIEIWNNVFMQFNRSEDGVMHPLPKPSVDTGMGLERLAAVLQHVHSNYQIDLFAHLLQAAQAAVAAAGGVDVDPDSPSLKVIADHIRACAFTVTDGVIPGNEGRGYVLRRIARRAIRHGYKLGARKPFFHTLVAALDTEMGEAYPELRRGAARTTDVLKAEEERFFQTIQHGMEILESALAAMETAGVTQIDGDTAFKLHDTFGFPVDLTGDVCRERGVTVDEAGFNAAMQRQRTQARASAKFKLAAGLAYDGTPTSFHGYTHLVCDTSRVTALYLEGAAVPSVKAGDDCVIVLDHTPFYAESGGQAGDSGELRNAVARVLVEDTTKIQADVFGHQGRVVEGTIAVGDSLAAKVNAEQRAKTVRNHSATHLMHKALREVLGEPCAAKGQPGQCRAHPLRLRPQRADDRRADPPRRGHRQCRDPGQCGGQRPGDGAGRCAEERRDDAVRRKVRRHRARAVHRQQQGTVRRHPCASHRRHRPVQDRGRKRRGRWHPPGGSGDRRQRAGLPAAAGSHGRPAVRRLEGHAGRTARRAWARCSTRCGRWKRRSLRSRASWPAPRATSCWPRRWTCAASRCWRPHCRGLTPRPCATRWTSSRTSSRPLPSCWRWSTAARCNWPPVSLPMCWPCPLPRSRPVTW